MDQFSFYLCLAILIASGWAVQRQQAQQRLADEDNNKLIKKLLQKSDPKKPEVDNP